MPALVTPRRARTLLPQPLLSLVLLAVWLLAHNSVSPGVVLLGLLLSLVIPLFTQHFWPEYPRTVRLTPLLRIVAVVLFDVLVANMRVARLILGKRTRLRPSFFVLPISLRSDFAITVLASVISLTPGTVSAELSADRRSLLVHGLDVGDTHEAIVFITERYERLLAEVFE